MMSTSLDGGSISPMARNALAKAAPDLDIWYKGEEKYEAARVWGARASHHTYWPEAVAFPTKTEEVAALVRWATAADISLCVKNGGHSGISFSKMLVVNMDEIKSVEVDPQASTVTSWGYRISCIS